MPYTRFVALGDSQTEGLGDPDPRFEYRGWADRLAEMIAVHSPGLHYANLAVRGKTTREALDEQLAPAIGMRPDLVAAPVGMNDVIGSADMGRVSDDLETLFGRLTDTGATVLTCTFPNLARTIPMGGLFEDRLLQINDLMRGFAERFGLVLVDLHSAPVLVDPRSWSQDRLHASPFGHSRFAEAAAHALNLPGSSDAWTAPLAPLPEKPRLARHAGDARWAVQFLTPWLIRKARGVSMGDGRAPKRPTLAPVTAPGLTVR
ncbi:MAG: SGNH/GDSL hydrolase family protein [Gordonia sp. (in: high G+C Gram-positive bacteria)]|uniref:SGNH/GDSL hydrolase family protein n=1 Tax=Gordonia sp. (in: high G+C Gram-positive bacteria) TaxID=84139 RepID=UPI0039E6A101